MSVGVVVRKKCGCGEVGVDLGSRCGCDVGGCGTWVQIMERVKIEGVKTKGV